MALATGNFTPKIDLTQPIIDISVDSNGEFSQTKKNMKKLRKLHYLK